MELLGDKIALAEVEAADIDFICKIECDKSIWLYEESVETDEQAVREKFLHRINQNINEKECFDFVILQVDSNTRKPIGLAQIWQYVKWRKSWEIGFALTPEHQGSGYGKAATELLLKFAFETLKAHRVVGMCNSQNIRSGAVMESVGMKKEGIFREELFWYGEWHDQWFYAILDKEYRG